MKKLFWLLAALMLWPNRPVFADALSLDLPYGIGTVQLPWQSTEVFYGMVKPFKGGLVQQIAGASLPVITLGKLKSGERLIDGHIGAAGAWPRQGTPADLYAAVGHDFAQDIPALAALKSSAHANACVTYSTSVGGWLWGGTMSYAFGGAPATP